MPEAVLSRAMPAVAAMAPRPEAAVTVEDVRLTLGGRPVLDAMSFELEARGVTVLMGPNGAGKSLTLRVLAGLIVPDAGVVSFRGGRPAPRAIAFVFQKPVLLRRSARANLGHALAVYGVPRRERPARIAELLHLAGLDAQAGAPARRLSGGEQQRLAMARALAAGPRFLLLDEPAASLDPQATAAIEALIRRAAADGVKVVLVTHDRGQAERLADDVLFLHRGRIAEAAPGHRFFGAPASAEAQAYLAGKLLV